MNYELALILFSVEFNVDTSVQIGGGPTGHKHLFDQHVASSLSSSFFFLFFACLILLFSLCLYGMCANPLS